MNDSPLFLDSTLPPALQQRVDNMLDENEELLWVGQPQPHRVGRKTIPIMVFGIPFTAFSVFWIGMASSMPAGFGVMRFLFPLFGIPFLLVGLGMLTAPYWGKRRALETCYALTDRRAVSWIPRFFGGMEKRTFGKDELESIKAVYYSDGTGDLVFTQEISVHHSSSMSDDSHGMNGSNVSVTPHGFLAIENVEAVERLIRKALFARSDD